MYNFIDVNEVSENIVLPSEALKINGEYIENLIPGYRTLTVSGREALSPELTAFETGVRDGSVLQNKRFPARTIRVAYQLIAESNEAYRAAYNMLAAILNVENAELIFNDEPDKFFIGTPSAIGEVEPGRNAVTGEFEIFCADPFKYSVIEYEAEPDLDDGSILINYNGTYKAYPTLEANFHNEDEVSEDGKTKQELTGNGDCGFVAFFNEREKIIQLGDPEEKDTATYPKSQTLIHQNFDNEFAWGSAAQSLWVSNQQPPAGTPLDARFTGGAVAMSPASYEVGEDLATSGTLLSVKSTAEKPYVNYKVTAKASGRKADRITVKVTITASLASSSNYFGDKRELKASIQFNGGDWFSVIVKNKSAYWRGNSGHTVNLTCVVDGLDANTDKLEDIKFKVERTDDLGKTGILDETKCNNLEINKYTAPVPDSWYLAPTSYASALGEWHGPTIQRTIPADAAGDNNIVDFTLSFKVKMCLGSTTNAQNQKGSFGIQVTDENGQPVSAIVIKKNAVGKKADVYFWTDATGRHGGTVNLTTGSSFSCRIVKSGRNHTFTVGNITKTYKGNPTGYATHIAVVFSQWSNSPALEKNGLYWVKFVKNNCETFKDIPNPFSTNDIVEADCKSGDVLLNNIAAPNLGALGNDWEEFYLSPGLNQIGIAYSDWATQAPSFKVRYREVFL